MVREADTGPFSPEVFPPSIQLLAAILHFHPDDNHQKTLSRLVDQSPDFPEIVKVHHLVTNVLSALQASPCELPDEMILPLKKHYPMQTSKALRNTTRLKGIAEEFEKYSIPYLPLKGIILGQQLFGDPTHRHPGDIDLLVEKERVREACSCLEQLGYKPSIPSVWPNEKQWDILLRTHYHVTLLSKDRLATVEVHWRAETHSCCFLLKDIKGSLEQVTLAGKTYPTLPNDRLLLYLAVHGSKHGWASLHWLYDFAILAMQLTDTQWNKVLNQAKVCSYTAHLMLGLWLAKDLLGLLPPDAVYHQLLQNRPADSVCGMVIHRIVKRNPVTSRERWAHLAYKLRFEPSWAGKRAALVKEWTDLDEWERVKLPETLYFLYYLIRPFSMLYRKLSHLSSGKLTRNERGRSGNE